MTRLFRRLTALAAAYAVALSTVLSAPGGLSAATGDGGSWLLCAAGQIADRGAPDRPQPLCPGGGACAMAGCPGAALGAPEAAALSLAAVPALPPPHCEGCAPARLGPGADHPARGPPAA